MNNEGFPKAAEEDSKVEGKEEMWPFSEKFLIETLKLVIVDNSVNTKRQQRQNVGGTRRKK